MLAYGQSKLCNVLHANELTRRFKVRELLSLMVETNEPKTRNEKQ